MMLFLIRPRFLVLVAFLLTLSSPSALSAQNLSNLTLLTKTVMYDRHQVNISEPVCRDNLRTQLLKQQMMFSDSRQPVEVRRLAEEGIDVARSVFAEKQSYCDASMALINFLEMGGLENAQVPKTGQIQSFDQDQ